MKIRLVSCAMFLLLIPLDAFAGRPNWIKRATGFAGDCASDCRPVRVIAPDKATAVEVLYHEGGAYLRQRKVL